jgi:hypothetical protein
VYEKAIYGAGEASQKSSLLRTDQYILTKIYCGMVDSGYSGLYGIVCLRTDSRFPYARPCQTSFHLDIFQATVRPH